MRAANSRSHRHTNSRSISVKPRIKQPVNLARFLCQKQLIRSFASAGFRRLFFFHTLLFSPDNLMSTFFSSGIKTLRTSFSAFVLHQAAQWGQETHTTLRRFSVVLPTDCPSNYQVQIRSYHTALGCYPFIWSDFVSSYFSNWAFFPPPFRDGRRSGCVQHLHMTKQICWFEHEAHRRAWRGGNEELSVAVKVWRLLFWASRHILSI